MAHWLHCSLMRYGYAVIHNIKNYKQLGGKIYKLKVIRVQKFTKGSLGKIGGESERTSNGHQGNKKVNGL